MGELQHIPTNPGLDVVVKVASIQAATSPPGSWIVTGTLEGECTISYRWDIVAGAANPKVGDRVRISIQVI